MNNDVSELQRECVKMKEYKADQIRFDEKYDKIMEKLIRIDEKINIKLNGNGRNG